MHMGSALAGGGPVLVAGPPGCFFPGVIDSPRQVPAPSGVAWLFRSRPSGGPFFAVLRRDDREARSTLVAHLVDSGATRSQEEAAALLDDAAPEVLAVGW